MPSCPLVCFTNGRLVRQANPPSCSPSLIHPGAGLVSECDLFVLVSGPGMGPTSRRGRKTAPNLQSEEDFPTLGGDHVPVVDSAW